MCRAPARFGLAAILLLFGALGCAGTAHFQRACDEGQPSACRSLGALHERGEGVAKDVSRAFSLYERACKGGDEEACRYGVRAFQCGVGVPRDRKRTAEFLKLACTSGAKETCALDGRAGAAAAFVPDNQARLAEKLCLEGELGSCAALGWFLVEGHGKLSQPSRTLLRLEDACQQHSADACAAAAAMHVQGLGAEADLGRGQLLLDRSCALVNAPFCPITADSLPGPPPALLHAELVATIGKRSNEIASCAALERLCDPALAGRVALRMAVAPDGKVSKASVFDSTLRATGVSECLVERARTWTFPRPASGEPFEFVYPLFFVPEEVRK